MPTPARERAVKVALKVMLAICVAAIVIPFGLMTTGVDLGEASAVLPAVTPAAARPAAAEAALLVVNGAKNVEWGSYEEMVMVAYLLDEEFSAERVTSEITTRLESKGWRKADRHFRYPDSLHADLHRWRELPIDLSASAPTAHEWQGQWVDPAGNFVHYLLTYGNAQLGAPSDGDTSVLTVSGEWASWEYVLKMQAYLKASKGEEARRQLIEHVPPMF